MYKITGSKPPTFFALVAGLALAASGFGYQEAKDKSEEKPAASDNTKVNKRDRGSGRLNAGQQGNSKADRELTRKIRRALVEDKALSTYARNIKVITRDGAVTLRGPVRTEEEKKTVEAKAAEAAAGASITSEIEVAPKNRGGTKDEEPGAPPKQ